MNDDDASSSIQERPSPTGGASSHVPRQQSSSSLDDYEIIREIGRGGTAIVYEAYHKSLRRKVALKQLPAAAALDPRWQERFQNEVRATSQLSHSNIVPFYELGNGWRFTFLHDAVNRRHQSGRGHPLLATVP